MNFKFKKIKTSEMTCEVPVQVSIIERRNKRNKFLMIAAFFAFTLNLRSALTSLPPIIQEVKTLFEISDGLAGFLTSIPVLCFGLLTPVISLVIKNIRLETAIFLTLSGIAAGSVIRSAGDINYVIAGTTVIGISITAGNIVGLMILGRDFSDNISAMTGLYVCGMSIGSMFTMGLTAPLSHYIGWRYALAMPFIFATLAILMWILVTISRKDVKKSYKEVHSRQDIQQSERIEEAEKNGKHITTTDRSGSSSVLKKSLVWILSAAFASHTFLFYGITAWIPVYMVQTLGISDASAGIVASLFQTLGLVGCFGIPVLVKSGKFSTRARFTMVTVGWLLTASGFWFAPSLWAVWVVCGGFASGGGFTVIFSMIMEHAKDLDENRTMSTLVQTVGYIVASVSPFAIGHLHELNGSWNGGMGLLSGAAVLMIICGIAATCRSHDRY